MTHKLNQLCLADISFFNDDGERTLCTSIAICGTSTEQFHSRLTSVIDKHSLTLTIDINPTSGEYDVVYEIDLLCNVEYIEKRTIDQELANGCGAMLKELFSTDHLILRELERMFLSEHPLSITREKLRADISEVDDMHHDHIELSELKRQGGKND